mmetsp:Transcript_2210/g.4978  ORF Transcript_2210/g.4978 Transcript_2210/m.4978 type:complete len:111 (-) Transcript_2210:732-1064(-)
MPHLQPSFGTPRTSRFQQPVQKKPPGRPIFIARHKKSTHRHIRKPIPNTSKTHKSDLRHNSSKEASLSLSLSLVSRVETHLKWLSHGSDLAQMCLLFALNYIDQYDNDVP